MTKPTRQRLDRMLVDRGLVESRRRAQALIMAGRVRVDDRTVSKPGTPIEPHADLQVGRDLHPYVSRGGLKLEALLEAVAFDVDGLVCLDVGASTGGFTDCLLQNGAAHVFAVDVGYGQLAWKLRQDERVTVIERTNIRHMEPALLPGPVDLAAIDVSFISLRIVVPAVLRFLKPKARILALIKPQFEVGRGQVGKGGVVRDGALHTRVVGDLQNAFQSLGMRSETVIPSPILGPKGNREFMVSFLHRPSVG